MKSFLASFSLLLAAGIAFSQDRQLVPQREFPITFKTSENPAKRTLWVSRDDGKTWKTAEEAGVAARWGEGSANTIRCTVRLPEEGSYDFCAQFEDKVHNVGPNPQSSNPKTWARVEFREPRSLRWKGLNDGEEWIGGNQVILRWKGESKDLRAQSVQIYSQINGGPWELVKDKLDLESEHRWTIPCPDEKTPIWLRLAALASDGTPVEGPVVKAMLLPRGTPAVPVPVYLSWIYPKEGDEFIGGNQLIFRWKGETKELREKSAQIYAQYDSKEWKLVAKELEAEGEYAWILPSPETRTVIRFQLRAFDAADKPVPGPEISGTILPGKPFAGLKWEVPAAGTEWTGGSSVLLKWFSLGADFRERTAKLEYRVDAESWTQITLGLDPTGSYLWVVPNRETRKLQLRASAVTRAGTESAAESDPVAVRAVGRQNITQARTLYDRGRVLAAQKRLAEAKEKYEEAIVAWNDFGEVHNDLGAIYSDLKEPAKALEYFLMARKTLPSNPTAYVNAAAMELKLGLRQEALADLRDAVALGVEMEERTSVKAGEMLWGIVRKAVEAQAFDKAVEPCELILRIPKAARPTRANAEQMLEWIRSRK